MGRTYTRSRYRLITLRSYFSRVYLNSGKLVSLFGYVMAINFPLYFLLTWLYDKPSSLAWLRFIAMCCCIGLILVYHYAKQSRLAPYYWFMCVSFCLPFFFTYNLLSTHFSIFGIVSLWTAIFFASMVLDVSAFLYSLLLGAGSAYLAAVYLLPHLSFHNAAVDFSMLSNFLASIVIIVIFSHNRGRVRATISMLAHELRTPLMTLGGQVQCIQTALPKLINAYEEAKANSIPPHKLKQLRQVIYQAEEEVNQAHGIISLIASGTELNFQGVTLSALSMQNILSSLIEKLPEKLQHLVSLDITQDFTLNADPVMLQHIFQNLLRNAHYAINQAGKGSIHITVTQHDAKGIVIFQDSALGLSPKKLKSIFQPFYTNKDARTSSGLGLYYCKQAMEKLGGSIKADAQLGEWMRFTLSFKL